jgi:ketosteroid isomerase-like protein
MGQLVKKVIFSASLIALAACSSVPGAVPLDEAALIAEAEAADLVAMRAQNTGDLETFARYLAEDFAYIDLSGNRIGKEQILARRAEDKHAVISEMPSEDEAVVLAPNVVMFRGRTDAVTSYYGGLPRPGSSRYSVVWRKDAGGQWQMVASQTTDRIRREYPVKVRTDVAGDLLDVYAGSYVLETETPLTLRLRADGGRLLASIDGQFTDMVFQPESDTRFFTTERPFEIVMAEDACSLVMVTFGAETVGKRIVD